MDIELLKSEKLDNGWEIEFEVKLSEEESSRCDLDPLKYVGDYNIKRDSSSIIFNCIFDSGELRKNEKIEERLELIKKDIKSMVNNCLRKID